MQKTIVLIKGAGELASAIAHKLFMCKFKVIMTEIPCPKLIRQKVSFAQAVFDAESTVENVTAKLCKEEDIFNVLEQKKIPIIIDPECKIKKNLGHDVLVDAIIAKKNLGTKIDDAKLVIGIGPGFIAGKDADFVIESMRGHSLGRVISEGEALADTKIPGEILGFTTERVIRATANGIFKPICKIGDIVKKNQVIANVDTTPVLAQIDGVIRGLINNNLYVEKNLKIGDIDPRSEVNYCFQISEKGRNIAGGVLEAIIRSFEYSESWRT